MIKNVHFNVDIYNDSWDEFSVALSDVVKQEKNDKLRRLIDDLDDSAD